MLESVMILSSRGTNTCQFNTHWITKSNNTATPCMLCIDRLACLTHESTCLMYESLDAAAQGVMNRNMCTLLYHHRGLLPQSKRLCFSQGVHDRPRPRGLKLSAVVCLCARKLQIALSDRNLRQPKTQTTSRFSVPT